MILVLAGLVIGAAIGAWRAKARGGNGYDIAQYAAVHGLLIAIIATFITVYLTRG